MALEATMTTAPEAFEAWWQALPLRNGEITADHIRQAWDAGVLFEAAQADADADADTDMEAYQSALDVARAELVRLDAAMQKSPLMVTPAMRVRRAYLCKAIDGLAQLSSQLATH